MRCVSGSCANCRDRSPRCSSASSSVRPGCRALVLQRPAPPRLRGRPASRPGWRLRRRASLKTRLRVILSSQVVNFARRQVAAGAFPDPHKNLLRDVFDIGIVAEHAPDGANDQTPDDARRAARTRPYRRVPTHPPSRQHRQVVRWRRCSDMRKGRRTRAHALFVKARQRHSGSTTFDSVVLVASILRPCIIDPRFTRINYE